MFSRIFNIYESSVVAPIPTSTHALDLRLTFKKCSNSAFLQKDYDGEQKFPHFILIITIPIIVSPIESSLLAYDYESNMDILGVLYARFDRSKESWMEICVSYPCRVAIIVEVVFEFIVSTVLASRNSVKIHLRKK